VQELISAAETSSVHPFSLIKDPNFDNGVARSGINRLGEEGHRKRGMNESEKKFQFVLDFFSFKYYFLTVTNFVAIKK
jgi:hypothetical protein